jgi:hypothetical protein
MYSTFTGIWIDLGFGYTSDSAREAWTQVYVHIVSHFTLLCLNEHDGVTTHLFSMLEAQPSLCPESDVHPKLRSLLEPVVISAHPGLDN